MSCEKCSALSERVSQLEEMQALMLGDVKALADENVRLQTLLEKEDADSWRLDFLEKENSALRAALEGITRECGAMNKGPVAVMLAQRALSRQEPFPPCSRCGLPGNEPNPDCSASALHGTRVTQQNNTSGDSLGERSPGRWLDPSEPLPEAGSAGYQEDRLGRPTEETGPPSLQAEHVTQGYCEHEFMQILTCGKCKERFTQEPKQAEPESQDGR